MLKLRSLLVLSLSLGVISASSNVQAKVRDTEDIADCMISIGLKWENWYLVEDDTYRTILSGAELAIDAMKALEESQATVKGLTDHVNTLNNDRFDLQRELYKTQLQVADLQYVPWFKNPIFWGAVGLVVGAGVTTGVVIGTK